MKKLIHMLLLFSTTCLSAQTYSELIAIAKIHYQQDRNDSACFYLDKAIKLEHDKADPFVMRSFCKTLMEDHYGAIADLDTAIYLENDEAQFYLFRANNKNKLYDKYGALKDLNKCLSLNDQLGDAWYEKSSILQYYDKNQESLDCINKAIELEPANANYYKGRAFILHVVMGRSDEAFRDQSKAYQLKKDQNERFLEMLVEMAFKAKMVDSTIAYCRLILSKNPQNYSAYWKIARVQASCERNDSALFYFNKAIQIRPMKGMFLMRSAVYEKMKKYPLALTDLENAISLDSNYTEAYMQKAKILLENLHAPKAAVKVYDRLLELQYDLGKAYYYRALIYHDQLKEYQRACVDIQQAILFEYEPAKKELERICDAVGMVK